MICKVARTASLVSVCMTSFITCLLAAVRTIHLVFPLYVIKWMAIKISIAIYTLTILVLEGFTLQQSISGNERFAVDVIFNIEFIILVSVFSTVVLVNIVSLVKLYLAKASNRDTWRRKATITVLIISVIYCVCNIGSLVVFGSETETFSVWSYSSIPSELNHIAYFILLPLNSACNPVVYIIRKKDMRSHFKSLWKRLGGWLCRRERDNYQGVKVLQEK